MSDWEDTNAIPAGAIRLASNLREENKKLEQKLKYAIEGLEEIRQILENKSSGKWPAACVNTCETPIVHAENPECVYRKAFRVCRDEVRRLREENEILHRDLFYKG